MPYYASLLKVNQNIREGLMRKRNRFIFITVMILTIMWTTIAGAAEIVIGFTGLLSGPAAEYGQDCVNGVDLAIRDINGAGGISVGGKNYTFRLEKMDDRVDPTVATNNARTLRNEKKAIAIFNPNAQTMTKLMAINWEKGNEFILMAHTSMPQLTQLGNELLVAIAIPFTMYAKVYADIAWQNRWKKAAMLVTSNIYGDTWRKSFENEWIKKGGVITYSAGTDYYKRTDYAGPLAKALATNPDCMLIGGPTATTTLIIEQARAKGYEGGFILIDQAKLDAIHPVMRKPLLLEGSIGLALIKDIHYPAKVAFEENYKAAFKRLPAWESVVHYTSMHALARAIAASGTPNNAKAIRAAFPAAFPMLGDKYPMEMFGIQSNGTLIFPALVQSMKYGKFTQAKVYIWWAKTQQEYDAIMKITKASFPLLWLPMAN